MAKEVERKFLVVGDDWRKEAGHRFTIRQGYLVAEPDKSVRVRISSVEGGGGKRYDSGFVTMKFGTDPMSNDEYEYGIPLSDALELMDKAGAAVIEKTRHHVEHEGRKWEVDVFAGRHAGLVMAEIEGLDVAELNNLPPWVGKEVTRDSYYKNAALARSK